MAWLLAGCPAPGGLTAQLAGQPAPVVPWAPATAVDWPLWPSGPGYVVGGSGYRLGEAWPLGVHPGLGLGALLIPSRRIGTWLGWPGPLPPPLPLIPAFPVWADLPAPAPSASATAKPGPSVPPPATAKPGPSAAPAALPKPAATPLTAWTKVGWTPLPAPDIRGWPTTSWLLSPWGPVTLEPKSPPKEAPIYDLGFPTADGTPVSKAEIFVAVHRQEGRSQVVIYDYATRTVHPPPSLDGVTDVVGALGGGGILLVARSAAEGTLRLVDLLTGGYDPLPELADSTPGLNGNFSQRAAFIAYTQGGPGQRRAFLFDRRQRLIDHLSHLNHPGIETFAPNVDAQARSMAVVRQRPGDTTDLAIYDTISGLLDPLPEVNTPGNERNPFFDFSGRWLAYISDADGTPRARLFDRLTRTVDPLPDLDHLGPILRLRLSRDGYLLAVNVVRDGRSQVLFYVRASGVIDPVPELNPAGVEVVF